MGQNLAQPGSRQASDRLFRLLTDPSSRFLVLQGLVTIILSYELLFGAESVISRVMSNGVVMGLWLGILSIAMLPQAVLTATWFSAGLVTLDTLLVTGVIYLSRKRPIGSLYCLFCSYVGGRISQTVTASARSLFALECRVCGGPVRRDSTNRSYGYRTTSGDPRSTRYGCVLRGRARGDGGC